MRPLTLLFFLHQSMAGFFITEECAIDNRSLENRWDEKLIRHLMACSQLYSPPPINGSEPLRIKVFFALKSFRFNSEEQEFSAYTWTTIKWQDDRLKWDPNNYDGLEKVVVTSSDIWVPGIRLLSNTDDYIDARYWSKPCEIESTGLVRCVYWDVYKVKCGTNLRDWPFDAQNCNLEFGLYEERKIKLLLDVNRRAVLMIGADYGAEWDIMGYDQELDQNSERQLIIKFRLERHADILEAIVIYPSIILTALTLSGLLIDAKLKSRLLILHFSLMCHFNFLSELAIDIPKHSIESPRLILYYRGSFLMTSILIAVSYVLSYICNNDQVCYNWIVSVNDFVYTTFVKFMIWPRWESKLEESEDSNKFVKNWINFANIINSIWIAVSVTVYGIMYSMFIPHPIPIEY